MSENEEDLNSINKQKSIFSGMTRVKQINHLREKWSPKLKTPLETPPSSPWSRRTSPAKTPLGQTPGPYHDSGRPSTRRTQSMSASPRGQPMVTIVDMERYLAINTWLESNSINVAQIKTCGDDPRTKSKSYGLFDDMYSSLEVLESNLKNEISHLNTNEENSEDVQTKEKYTEERKDTSTASPPPLFDYLVVIGADMLDVKIRNFWNERENVFESTSVFAHPPESQFTAESLEHFCFPTGVKSFNTLGTSCDRRNELPDENPNFKQGEFFVLMISGGGVHGQSVQYAMCMKGVIVIRGPDGRNVLLPMCYCIIVQIPLIPFFRALLQGFLDNLRSELDSSNGCIPSSSIVTDEHAGYIDDVLQTLKNISLPDKGQSISVQVFPSPSPELTLARPHMDEKAVLVLQWALPSLLSHLSIDRLLQIMSLLLVEVKLVVVSDEIALLSSATLGFASLLNPLTWAGPLISVLPPSMHEYMEAPVPLICGVDELPRDFECSKGTCILHLAENRVQLHFEDERSIGKLQMPELKNLSCDLTRFTKQMLGRVTGSFRDNVTPLSTHLVIHRVRRHIEHVISVCALRREQHRNQEASYPLDASELNFVEVFMKTQMYQKYQDDQPISASTEQSNQQLPSVEPVKHALPIKTCPINTQHNGLKAAASVLFQIALAGVSTQPQGTTPSNIQDDDILISKIAVDEEIEIPSHDGIALPTPDKPDPGSVKLSSAASSPARLFSSSSMKTSPHEKAESLFREYELLSPTVNETSARYERRPDRKFVWPLSQSESDVFCVSDEASPASFLLLPPRCDSFESPRRTTNNESDASYVQVPKNVTCSEQENLVNAQRTDTEMIISILDTPLSEAFGSADTTGDAWLFESPNDARSRSKHNYDSGEDRSTRQSSAESDDTPVHSDALTDDNLNNSSVSAQHSRQEDLQNDIPVATHLRSYGGVLTLDQVKTLTTGVVMESRGAWEGWCEGHMYFSPDCSKLTWERRAVAFAALNMNIRDITSMTFEDNETGLTSGRLQQRVQLNSSAEAIYFQFSISSLHDNFFKAMKQLVHSTQDSADRRRSLPSLSSPPHLLLPVASTEYNPNHDHTETTKVATMHSFVTQKETEIHQFKRKLQQGFLVEKHGRLGKPHAKVLFTNESCSHVMWRKLHPSSTGDQHKLNQPDDQLQRRSRLFSHDKNIPVNSITAIVSGKQTTVFRRTVANKSNGRVCLSILTSTRTLDICANSLNEFHELYRGFSLLLEEIKRKRNELE